MNICINYNTKWTIFFFAALPPFQVPRQLLLLFKTNDLLRGIEASLSSPPSASSFLNMSRVCLRAVDEDWKKYSCGYTHWIRTTARTQWELMKISAYEWALWWRGS